MQFNTRGETDAADSFYKTHLIKPHPGKHVVKDYLGTRYLGQAARRPAVVPTVYSDLKSPFDGWLNACRLEYRHFGPAVVRRLLRDYGDPDLRWRYMPDPDWGSQSVDPLDLLTLDLEAFGRDAIRLLAVDPAALGRYERQRLARLGQLGLFPGLSDAAVGSHLLQLFGTSRHHGGVSTQTFRIRYGHKHGLGSYLYPINLPTGLARALLL